MGGGGVHIFMNFKPKKQTCLHIECISCIMVSLLDFSGFNSWISNQRL